LIKAIIKRGWINTCENIS